MTKLESYIGMTLLIGSILLMGWTLHFLGGANTQENVKQIVISLNQGVYQNGN